MIKDWLHNGKWYFTKEMDAFKGWLQFVWWGWRDGGWAFIRYDDPNVTSWAYIYAWRLCLGPIEIRRWAEPFDVVNARLKK